jgi:hypothetical protein
VEPVAERGFGLASPGKLSDGARPLPIVFCVRCGSQVAEGSRFCPHCGTQVVPGPPNVPLASVPQPSTGLLTGVPHLVMFRDKLAMHSGFQIQDPSGKPLGEIRGGARDLLGGLTLLDTDRRVVLGLRAASGHGLQFGVTIHDANGAPLATLQPKTGFTSQKWGIMVGTTEPMLLAIEVGGLRYHIEEVGTGRVLATADRPMAVRLSRTDIQIPELQGVDRRIVIGSMIAAAFFTIRGSI